MVDKPLDSPRSRMLESLERLCQARERPEDIRYYFGDMTQGDVNSLSEAIKRVTGLVRGRASHYGDQLAGVFACTISATKAVRKGVKAVDLWTLPVSELYYDRTCIVHMFEIMHSRGTRRYGYTYDLSYNETLRDRSDMAHLYRLGVPLRTMDEVLLANRLRR